MPSKTKVTDSPAVSAVITYLILLFVPVFSAMALGVYYQSADLPIYKDVLCFPEILFNGISACTLYFYLTHTRRLRLSSGWTRFLFSFAYAFSSYLLVQEHILTCLALYAIFPLLFLCFENFVSGGKSLPFVLLLALCLLIDPFVSGALAIYFAVVFFFETDQCTFSSVLSDFLHLLALVLFAFLISGVLTVPRLYAFGSMFSGATSIAYRPAYPVSVFLSRFLMGSVFYQLLGYYSGISLYVGIFVLLCVFLYFANSGIPAGKRIRALFCLGILLLTLELGPLRDLMEFGNPSAPATVYYCFFFLFWFLRLGLDGLLHLRTLSARRIVVGTAGALGFVTLVLCGSMHNFHPAAILANYLFLILYGALLLLWHRKKEADTALLLKTGVALGILELAVHAFLCTNASLVPATVDGAAHYVWNNISFHTADVNAEPGSVPADGLPYEEEYAQFAEDHSAASFLSLVRQLRQTTSLTKEEEQAAYSYELWTLDGELNLRCGKAGASRPLLTPVPELSITFRENTLYRIIDQGNFIYNLDDSDAMFPYVYTACDITVPDGRPVIVMEDYFGTCFLLEPETAGETFTCYFRLPKATDNTVNFRICGYTLDTDLAAELPALLAIYEESHVEEPALWPYYAGVFCSLAGIFLLLCFVLNRDRQKLIDALLKLKQRVSGSGCLAAFSGHCSRNRVYYLAFFLPFTLYLLMLAWLRCEPFGPYSLLDQDGIKSIFPHYLDMYNSLGAGDFHFNWNSGFGSFFFPVNIFRLLLLLIPRVGMISTVMVLSVGVMMSFSAFATVYYLTHRLSSPQADKEDCRLLIPALIYSMNTFMLAMNGYVDWFSTYMLLPLIVLALDRLIYRKKWLTYVLLLSFCMYMNIQLALYICIALFFLFFTYRFEGVRDFLAKGIRFALCSILCACNSFLTVGSNFLYVQGGTAYAQYDTVRPTFRFFGSFLDQWKNLMVFSPSSAVSASDLHINVYMGILTLFLAAASFHGKQVTRKVKVTRLIFLGLLLFSFNEELTAYVINGFHYQSNVPNRHVFLLMFLCAVMAYDGVQALSGLSRKALLLLTAAFIGFFAVCQFGSEGNTYAAFVSTVILLLVFGLLCTVLHGRASYPSLCGRIAVLLLVLELSANLLYTTSNFVKACILNLGDYPARTEYSSRVLQLKETGYRAITPAFALWGEGSFTNTPGITLFNPYISGGQKRLASLYGYHAGVNYILSNYDSTPAGNSMAAVKYLLLKKTAFFALPDLKEYRYIGDVGDAYLLENPYVFPLGIYAPEELVRIPGENLHVLSYVNWIAALYCDSTEKPLYNVGFFNQNSTSGQDICLFLDREGNAVSAEDALAIAEDSLSRPGTYFPVKELTLDITICPKIDGPLYLYSDELVYLGEGKSGTPFHTSLYLPAPADPGSAIWISFDQDVWNTFRQTVLEQTLEDITVKDNRITGTTHYREDGYTMFSLPYSSGWKAYIDGREAATRDSAGAFLLVETPAGDHTLELVFPVSSSFMLLIGISLGSLAFTLLCYAVSLIWHRRRAGQ